MNSILISLDNRICKESTDLSDRFPIVGGSKWEFTNKWKCRFNDIGSQTAVLWDGSQAAIDRREDCARKCLESQS